MANTNHRTILFATGNSNKTREARAILGGEFVLRDLSEIGFDGELKEEEDTLEGNAISKAKQALQLTEFESCFAEDTGLEVVALGGAPGVFSARYAGKDGNSEANIKKLLENLEGVPDRRARFRTVIAYVRGEEVSTFEGIVEGTIGEEPKGRKGFGYDPVFIPRGYNQTFAQLPISLKNKISHRARAFEKFTNWLRGFQR
ncbi:MAG: RdgB/HAM1 family non-canonical purine NTP pyrophosphatase [Saprospirales bacterium]|nr:MAG: RdgB/HAM1 family non-canonical purine NTP pyrophosphatase [Saprospirales bacterium]